MKPALLLLFCLMQLPIAFAAQIPVATVQFDSVDGGFDKNLADVVKNVHWHQLPRSERWAVLQHIYARGRK